MNHLETYYLYSDRVVLVLTDGNTQTIFFNNLSGTIYYRLKINTISNVKHPGIYLGVDAFGNNYYMHNHYENGKPAIVSEFDFTLGQPIHQYDQVVSNAPLDVINAGLSQVLAGKQYNWLNYNCQSFANEAGQAKRRSQAVENWAGGIGLGLLLLFGLKNMKF